MWMEIAEDLIFSGLGLQGILLEKVQQNPIYNNKKVL
jgi:hypothetical protein